MGRYEDAIAKAESRYSGADGEGIKFTVLKDFSVSRVMPTNINVRLAMPQPRLFKAGEIVTVVKMETPVIVPIQQKMALQSMQPIKKQVVASADGVNSTEVISVDGINYNMPTNPSEYLQQIDTPIDMAEKTSVDTTTTDKFFLGMTKKTTAIVGVVVLVFAVGGFIYYKKFYKK